MITIVSEQNDKPINSEESNSLLQTALYNAELTIVDILTKKGA